MGTTVFVANFAGHDYTAAEKYGTLKYVTRGYISFNSLDRVKFQCAEGIKDSTPEDFLLVSGTAIVNAITALAWIAKHGVVQLLNFDARSGDYRLVIASVHNFRGIFAALEENPDGVIGPGTEIAESGSRGNDKTEGPEGPSTKDSQSVP